VSGIESEVESTRFSKFSWEVGSVFVGVGFEIRSFSSFPLSSEFEFGYTEHVNSVRETDNEVSQYYRFSELKRILPLC
jgi:hypothetical protein